MLRYFISKEFFLTLFGLVILVIVGVILVFLVFLPGYTNHGEAIVVPNVFEMDYTKASKELDKLGLHPEVQDCTYIEDFPPLVVVQQRPVALSRVKEDRTIFLTINKRTPPMVAIPNVVDLSLYHAKSTLESWKLGVGSVSFRRDIANNVVLEAHYEGEEIAEGTKVPQGSKIDLVVGRSSGSFFVEIPDLVGYTHDEALDMLRERGLRVGSLTFNPNGPRSMFGRVFSQEPRADYGDSIRVGDPVDLYIYGDTPEDTEGVDIQEP